MPIEDFTDENDLYWTLFLFYWNDVDWSVLTSGQKIGKFSLWPTAFRILKIHKRHFKILSPSRRLCFAGASEFRTQFWILPPKRVCVFVDITILENLEMQSRIYWHYHILQVFLFMHCNLNKHLTIHSVYLYSQILASKYWVFRFLITLDLRMLEILKIKQQVSYLFFICIIISEGFITEHYATPTAEKRLKKRELNEAQHP